jgi:cell division ATPase FtsA
MVYSAVLKRKEEDIKMAVKVYFPVNVDDKLGFERDMYIGFELRLKTEYTLNYEDMFDAGPFKCVVMELMTTSLENFLNPLINSNPKKLEEEIEKMKEKNQEKDEKIKEFEEEIEKMKKKKKKKIKKKMKKLKNLKK